jgi:hypothetical protein
MFSLPIFCARKFSVKNNREKALCALWAGRSVSLRGYEAFLPRKQKCPSPLGRFLRTPFAKGVLKAAFFPGVSLQKQRNPEKESLSI